jgi:tetratricopeptide (TPR) repeat protein
MNRAVSSVAAVSVLCAIHAACAFDPPSAAAGQATGAGSFATERPAAPNDGRQATSLLGRPLFQPLLSEARRGQVETNVEMARRAYDANPNESTAIAYGRQLANLGKFREAIDVYTRALAEHPRSYRLLRHRGHRYITCREFDLALADLTRAWDLVKDQPDAPEPDSEPRLGSMAEPRSTDKSNILYHLALVHYFRGEFERAAELFGQYPSLAKSGTRINDDMIVSFANWQHLALRQLGRDKEAAAVLKVCRPRMDVRENQAYHALLRVYKGEVPADVLANSTQTNQSTMLAIGYGVGAYKLFNGDRAGAQVLFDKLVAHELWPSFGVIAAEAELARQQNPLSVPTPTPAPAAGMDP